MDVKSVICGLSAGMGVLVADGVTMTTTTCGRPWRSSHFQWCEDNCAPADLSVDIDSGRLGQQIDGFGGCFSELGYAALKTLDEGNRDLVIRALFADSGCDFRFGRMPMGASDFALQWHSYNETPGDFSMSHFSIERDRTHLIPFIKMALRYQPALQLWGSPWSPPSWMKGNGNYASRSSNLNPFPAEKQYVPMQDQFLLEPAYLQAYALYFAEFIKAYAQEGIKVYAVHAQNELYAAQIFPSCVWKPESLARFACSYLEPELRRQGLDTEIWLGTINDGSIANVDAMLQYTEDPSERGAYIVTPIKGTVYDNSHLEGKPVTERMDRQLDFNFSRSKDYPLPGKTNDFSLDWQGEIVCERSDSYEIVCRGDDGYRVYVDDKLVLDHWQRGGRDGSVRLKLSVGKHAFRVSYRQLGGEAFFRVTLRRWNIELARRCITGLGFQWAGRDSIGPTHEKYPEFKTMQTESECGDGKNDWQGAVHTYELLRHYFAHGANSYMYWNMILSEDPHSTWGWSQNSMISIHRKTHQVVYNPEYYVMKHYSHFVKSGARYVTVDDPNTSAFVSGGKLVVIHHNAGKTRKVQFCVDGRKVIVPLEKDSFNTLVFD